MQGTANIFTADANMLAQMTGKGNMPLVLVVTPTNPYNIAGTTLLDETAGLFQQLITGAGNTTLNTITVGKPGQQLYLEIANDAGGARTITFGANFRPTAATAVGTASRSMMFQFMSNGVKWMEMSRTTAIV